MRAGFTDNEHRKTSILVVDDEHAILHVIEAMLSKIGISVYIASSIQRAMEVLKTNRKIDIILCDLTIGNECGITCIESAKRIHPHIIPIGMSGMSDGMSEFKKAGVNYFLPKPVLLEKLRNVIHEAMGK